MSATLPPIYYRLFTTPLPYRPTLALQHKIHEIQLARRKVEAGSHPDVLLLLQHRPTYTGGRRQNAQDLSDEESRLSGLGADWVPTQRGGETTYHGPGQIVGYPLVDLGRMGMSIRDYICKLEKLLKRRASAHGVDYIKSEHTGLFTSPTEKLGSIGVQVRHRLTTHGFAYNVTEEPLAWFDQVIACGLADVKATSLSRAMTKQGKASGPRIEEEMNHTVDSFGQLVERQMIELDEAADAELFERVSELEALAVESGPWPERPHRL